jgi:hypothetical protein
MFLVSRQFDIAGPGYYVKKYVYNIRLEIQVEIQQRYVVSYLHRKGMKLPAIVAELAAVYHEDAFDENMVKYSLHEIESHCSDLSDRPSSGPPPLEDVSARILQVLKLSHGLWLERSLSSSRSLCRWCISI